MVATVRCEEIANEKLKNFLSNKVTMFLCHSVLLYLFDWLNGNYSTLQGWLELDAAVKSGLPPSFGTRLIAILDSYLSEWVI